MDSLEVLDPERQIREADIGAGLRNVCFVPILLQKSFGFQGMAE
jgi:hypothetical protein